MKKTTKNVFYMTFSNKIVSIILTCSLLLMCLSGCSIIDGNKPEVNEEKSNNPMDLNGFLAKLQKDSEEIDKLEFTIEYQDLHYELSVLFMI